MKLAHVYALGKNMGSVRKIRIINVDSASATTLCKNFFTANCLFEVEDLVCFSIPIPMMNSMPMKTGRKENLKRPECRYTLQNYRHQWFVQNLYLVEFTARNPSSVYQKKMGAFETFAFVFAIEKFTRH